MNENNDELVIIDDLDELFDNPAFLSDSEPYVMVGAQYTLDGKQVKLNSNLDYDTISDPTIISNITCNDRNGGSKQIEIRVTLVNIIEDVDQDDLFEDVDVDDLTAELQFSAPPAGGTIVNGNLEITHPVPIQENNAETTIISDLDALFDNPTYLHDATPYTLTGDKFTLTGTTLKLISDIDYDTLTTAEQTNVVASIVAKDELNNTKTITVKVEISNVVEDVDDDDLLETVDDDDLTAGLQFSAAAKSAGTVSGTTLTIQHGDIAENNVETVMIASLNALFDNPTYLRTSTPYTKVETFGRNDFLIAGDQLKLAGDLDFESRTNKLHTATITAHDRVGGSRTIIVTFNLTNVIEDADSDLLDETIDTNDNVAALEFVDSLPTNVAEVNGTVTITRPNAIIENHNQDVEMFANLHTLFKNPGFIQSFTHTNTTDFVVSTAGKVTVLANRDYESTGATTTTTITVTDSQGGTQTIDVVVNITDVNEWDNTWSESQNSPKWDELNMNWEDVHNGWNQTWSGAGSPNWDDVNDNWDQLTGT